MSQDQQPQLIVIEGGQPHCQGKRQDKVLTPPELAPVFVQMRRYRAKLAKPYAFLLECVNDLRQDWGPREEPFWQGILEVLPLLRDALKLCSIWVNTFSLSTFPQGFLAIHATVITNTNNLQGAINSMGIEITAYCAVCTSTEIQHLHWRDELRRKLEELITQLHILRDLLGPLGQQRCIQEHTLREQERAAWKAKQPSQVPNGQEEDHV
jgi:hypothetical protein